MDANDLFFGSMSATNGATTPIVGPSRGGESPANALEPIFQEEIDAIVGTVPRPCRANAVWAVPLLLTAARSGGITHPRRIAYVLATAQHASQFGAQLVETGTGTGGDHVDRFFDRYEPDSLHGAALGNTKPGDGERFRGRGFVHIRGRAAYALWSQRLGLPEQFVDGAVVPFLIAQPAALARPDVAAQTLVRGMRDGLFTGVPLGIHVNDKKTDYVRARLVIGDPKHARDVADIAAAFALTIERFQTDRQWRQTQQRATAREMSAEPRDFSQEINAAVKRLALRGEHMDEPLEVIDWNGEPRQGKFVQLDEHTCALHTGRGTYVRLDVQRDLNGIVPPEALNVALRRSGDVRPATRHGEVNFWK